MNDKPWVWYYLLVILLSLLALVCVYKKKQRKSFEVLMIHLFIQNFTFLTAALIALVNHEKYTIYVISFQIFQLCYFLECTTVLLITLQRLVMVYFPINATIWITKKRTNYIIIFKYLLISIVASIPTYIKFYSKTANANLKKNLTTFLHVLPYLMATVTMFSNILIIHKIRKSASKSSQLGAAEERRRKNNKRAAILLLMISTSFIISYIIPLPGSHERSSDSRIHALWVDSFVNSISYFVIATNFTKSIRKKLGRNMTC